MSDKGLTDIVFYMNDLGLNIKYLIGRGCDGTSSMSGRYNSIQKYVRDKN